MSLPIEDIKEEVRDVEFAKEYGEGLAKINVAVTLSEARIEKGLTQEQLAVMSGTSQPYIAKLESGDANPSVGAVGKILAVLGFRFVPGKDPLVSETKLPFQVIPSLTVGALAYTTAVNYTPLLSSSPAILGDRIPSLVAYKTVSGIDASMGESNKEITANSENILVAF
jgi:transcriptional regulator with XRE-family HTH domain